MRSSEYLDYLDAIKRSAIGQSLSAVRAEARRKGWRVRVVFVDGRACIGTCDYVPERINVAVERGVVTEIRGLG